MTLHKVIHGAGNRYTTLLNIFAFCTVILPDYVSLNGKLLTGLMSNMKSILSLAGGFAGACALTALHEILRKKDADAPRMDLLGMNALAVLIRKAGGEPPEGNKLFGITMAGDVASNAFYYSIAGKGDPDKVWSRGLLLGLAAGAGAVLLPKPLGLNEQPSNRTVKTKLMTVALYTTGGLVAAAAISLLQHRQKKAGL